MVAAPTSGNAHKWNPVSSMLLLFSIVLIICGAVSAASGDNDPPAQISPSLFTSSQELISGSYENSLFWGVIDDLDVSGNYVYCAMGLGLAVIDISDPSDPKWYSQLYLPAGADRIHISGSLAYLLTSDGLIIVDIANPASPQIVGQLPPGASLYDLDVAGDYIYISNYNGRHLVIINVSDPSNPTIVGTYQTYFEPTYVAVQDTIAIVSVLHSGFHLISIADPTSPYVLWTFASERPRDVVLTAGYAFATDRDSGLIVFDIADPSNPSVVAAIPGNFVKLNLVGTRLFITTSGAPWIVDVSDPTHPMPIGANTPDTILNLINHVPAGNLVIAGDYDYGLRIFDISNIATPVQLSEYHLLNGVSNVKTEAEVAYIAAIQTGFHIFDISDPTLPVELSQSNDFGTIRDFDIVDTLAVLAAKGVHLVSIAHPTNPYTIAQFDTAMSYARVLRRDTLVFATEQGSWDVNIISFGDPSHPVLVGSWNGNFGDGLILGTYNEYLYVGSLIPVGSFGQRALRVLDISDPSSPQDLGYQLYQYSLRYFVVDGPWAYLTEGHWLHVMDLTGLDGMPIEVDRLKILSAERVSKDGDRVYVGTDYRGLTIVDVTNPSQASIIGEYSPALWSRTGYVATKDDFAYIATSYGLVIAQFTSSSAVGDGDDIRPTSISLSQNHPNPFNSGTTIQYELNILSRVSLDVFNILGRHVFNKEFAAQPAGRYSVTWGGKNRNGTPSPSGVYFYRLTAGDESVTRKMVLLR